MLKLRERFPWFRHQKSTGLRPSGATPDRARRPFGPRPPPPGRILLGFTLPFILGLLLPLDPMKVPSQSEMALEQTGEATLHHSGTIAPVPYDSVLSPDSIPEGWLEPGVAGRLESVPYIAAGPVDASTTAGALDGTNPRNARTRLASLPDSAAGAGRIEPASVARANGLIMLITDFGSRGYLLGSLKGAIYGAYPEARIDSLTHDIPKFDIDEAAQTLALSTADFPAGTVFVAVVDPGIGRPRNPIALETANGHLYLAPDNGILTQVAIRYRVKRVHEISNPAYLRASVQSSTYLSRDVFGPAAGALARGVDLGELGPPCSSLYLLTSSPARLEEQQVVGTVSLIDGFGNVHTNIREAHLQELGIRIGDPIEVSVGERRFQARHVKTFRDVEPGAHLAMVGSHEEIQLAINQGNLATVLEIQKGQAVVLRRP